MKKIFLTLSLMTAMFFVSCDQNSADDEVQGSALSSQASLNSQAKLASTALTSEPNCTPVSDNAVVTKALVGSSGDYCVWNDTIKTIGSTTVQFEGMYGSGIRPAEEGWYIGVVADTVTCGNWDFWKGSIVVKNAVVNVGDFPDCTSVIIPENVVGVDGVVGTEDYGLGYYTYSGRSIVITKKIVIWKDNLETDPDAITNPSNASEAYLIEVTSIVPTFGTPPFYGTVSYTYTKVL